MGVKYLGGMHMSNNQLTKSNKVKYVPKLRFSEFKKVNSWKKKQLQNVCEINPQSKKLPKSFIYIDLESVDDGRLLKKQHVNVENAPSRAQRVLQINDILFQTVRPYQKNNYLFLIKDQYKYIASTGYAQLRTNESVHYLYQYIHTDNFVDAVLEKCTGTNYPAINSTELAKIDILIPNLAEQQKIAACLSSFDELIQNESNKLEAYKQYKDGLLQQLFPKNGESLPSLRFDEFSEEWENIELSKLAKPVKKKNTGHDKILVLSLSNEYGLVSQVDYFQKKIAGENTDRYIVLQKNDFVYNDRITKNSTYGTIKRLSLYEEGIVSPIYKCFRFEKNQNPVFWEYYFESKCHENEIRQIINEGARAGRYNISTDSFLSINVMLPSQLEQEKIASCLTSLDETITRQNNYIECLKEHKKGLMQQLFPVLEDFSA